MPEGTNILNTAMLVHNQSDLTYEHRRCQCRQYLYRLSAIKMKKGIRWIGFLQQQ